MSDVLVTPGANGGLHAFIMALVEPGDEILFIEPYFTMYRDHAKLANGVIKTVPITVQDGTWKLDLD